MVENKIEIRNLYKSFGKKKVLDGVDLDIKKSRQICSTFRPDSQKLRLLLT